MKISRLYNDRHSFLFGFETQLFPPLRCRRKAGTMPAGQAPVTGTAGTTYTLRWTISNSPCTASANDVVISFNQNPTTSNAGSNQSSTCGSTAVIAGTVPTGESGVYKYPWEQSTTSSSAGFTVALGTNNARDYVAGTLSQNTWYRRTVISGSCTNNVSGVLLFKVVSAGTWTGAVSTAWQIRILYL